VIETPNNPQDQGSAIALERIPALLESLYGAQAARGAVQEVRQLLDDFRPRLPQPNGSQRRLGLTQRDALLIAYGDAVREEGQALLRTLTEFCESHLRQVSGIFEAKQLCMSCRACLLIVNLYPSVRLSTLMKRKSFDSSKKPNLRLRCRIWARRTCAQKQKRPYWSPHYSGLWQ